jgi:hypothetical protein
LFFHIRVPVSRNTGVFAIDFAFASMIIFSQHQGAKTSGTDPVKI